MKFAVPDRYAFSPRISEVKQFRVSETLLLAAGSTSNIAETFTSDIVENDNNGATGSHLKSS
jgi:hypothetical protein